MKNIVVIGGGSGIFNVLKGLKNYPVNITSIVTTFDNGGSTGILRDEFGILPPGDIRRSLIALSSDDGDLTLRDLFNFRFEENSSLIGHSFGNLFIQALTQVIGSEIGAIKQAGEILNIKGNVLPISIDNAHVCAELADGSMVEGETNIDIPKHDGSVNIKKIFLKPKATIYRESYDAILEADLIVIGPGDLYTSILPNIIVDGFMDAIGKTRAKIVYILNIMTKWGETNNFYGYDFARVLSEYMDGRKFDYIIANSEPVKNSLLKKYEEEKAFPVNIDINKLKEYSIEVVFTDLMNQSEIVRHDSKKLSRAIIELL